ncbi:MAG: hypothetical protein KDK99_01120 [Verrucomicrobiales bacterium]|nr:hypothetical protein [Verrucomicrobiales bacterium]
MKHQVLLPHQFAPATEIVFDVASFGQVSLPEACCRLGFQVDIVPSLCPDQLLFGVIHLDENNQSLASGFAIRLDLDRGEIWDAVNNTGLIGWLDVDQLSLARFTEEEPLLLSFEIEHTGHALIPTLRVGDEEWLYPSLNMPANRILGAIAGVPEGSAGSSECFLHPALWREQD